jgi:nicotinamidase-related amidase
MKRAAGLVDRIGKRVNSIYVTMDSHRVMDIGHPSMYMDKAGKAPAPLATMISAEDFDAGIWTTRNPAHRSRVLKYLRALKAQGNYPAQMVWPEHCLIGTWGHNIQEDLLASLQHWERTEGATVDTITKGTNVWTEHYGALMAEVTDYDIVGRDDGVLLNTDFLEMLQAVDMVGILGEASSHCVLATVQQVVDNIGAEHLKKLHLITDCMSPVGDATAFGGPCFPAIAAAFLTDMEKRGLNLTTSDQFLA